MIEMLVGKDYPVQFSMSDMVSDILLHRIVVESGTGIDQNVDTILADEEYIGIEGECTYYLNFRR